ncbi:hypothetical protein ACFQZ4_43445 [Catellatospora coxensis]
MPDETASPPAVLTILLQERAQLMVAAADAVGQVWQWWFEPRHQEMLHSIDGMRRSLALAPVGTTGQEPGERTGRRRSDRGRLWISSSGRPATGSSKRALLSSTS